MPKKIASQVIKFKVLEPRVERLRELLFKRFSVPLAPYIQTLSELRHKHRQGLPLIREIQKDGRTINGKEINQLLSLRRQPPAEKGSRRYPRPRGPRAA